MNRNRFLSIWLSSFIAPQIIYFQIFLSTFAKHRFLDRIKLIVGIMVHFSSFKYRNVFIFLVAAFDLMAMFESPSSLALLLFRLYLYLHFIYCLLAAVTCFLTLHTHQNNGGKFSLAVHRNISTTLVTKFSPKEKRTKSKKKNHSVSNESQLALAKSYVQFTIRIH